MADIKATSFRVNEEDIAKFKEFAEENGYNQAEAFKSIIQTLEMAKAKNIIKDRAKEIEVFQDTINNLMSMFLNSLNVNQTSEERIREELSKELQTKDNTISNLQEQLKDVKAENSDLKEINKDKDSIIKQSEEEVKRVNSDNADKQKNIDKLNSNNDLLQEQLQEYRKYKDNYIELEIQLKQLRAEHEEIKADNNKLINKIDLLNNKIVTDTDMLEFYKTNTSELKANIEGYKADIKSLEEKYNKQIESIKAENITTLQEQLKANIDNLNSKHEVELSKKDLEIEKLNSEINLLKTKSRTTKKIEK